MVVGVGCCGCNGDQRKQQQKGLGEAAATGENGSGVGAVVREIARGNPNYPPDRASFNPLPRSGPAQKATKAQPRKPHATTSHPSTGRRPFSQKSPELWVIRDSVHISV
ncbi:hypothetical protein BRADI_4g20844v3 [Brachypodium distachyon]|uniref:Uncharacterized protein n=1 Tax=Brachypodium distachyon TaxID=15368 RepID=A0A2K2CP21_BRADI|nr:hypothetical protein BRADI_4g20844v3 [Brachypodium distachyon]